MPQIHFCKSSDGLRIAYAQDGRGPAMIEVAKWLNHVEYDCLNRMVRSCPHCGGRMFVIETFEPGCQPRHPPTAPLAAIRIDTS
jgi:hypothetical protein